MTVFRAIVLVSVLFTTVYSLKCYTGETNGYDKPSLTMDCVPYQSKFCVKARAEGGNGICEAMYACAQGDQCTVVGCMNAFGATKCCCNTDYCNSSHSISLLAVIISTAVVKLFTF